MINDVKPKPVDLKISGIEPKKLDVSLASGKETLIEFVEIYKGTYGYYMKISCVPVRAGEDDDAQLLTPTRNFSIKEDENGAYGWDVNDETPASLVTLMKKHKVDHPDKLIAKSVKTNVVMNNGKQFLSFV